MAPPPSPDRLRDAAAHALAGGDFPRCRQLAAALVAAAPGSADGHFLLGLADAGSGRIGAAIAAVGEAVRLAPDAEKLAQQARLLTLARREGDARAAADRALGCRPTDPLTIDTIGCVYARLGDHEAALPLFETAVAARPANLEYRFNLASTLGFFGRSDAAATHYEAMLAIAPANGKAHLGLAGLRRQTPATNHVARLEAALATMADPIDRLRTHYAAAKEYEDIGQHAAAFRHLDAGNRAHKRRIGFDIDAEQAVFAGIRAGFAAPAYFRGTSAVPDAPIFVLGLPRTGTTLVDRILASHPDVTSAGELQAMPLAIKQLAGTRSRLVLDVETVAAAGGLAPDAVGRAYLDRARRHVGGTAARFTDKLPLNFLYAGYIARAMPNARLVCLRRQPMDSVWSNYKNLFATTSSYYAYSYDLIDTARYYLLFDRLMAYWETLIPGRILRLDYEALVDDQEGRTRALLDHCGLGWDDRCLRFHEQDGAVATPSAAQVRRPINRDAVGRWRAYAAQLEPIRALFAAEGIATD